MTNIDDAIQNGRISSSFQDKWQKPFLRIGHSGAGYYAPPNSLKSISLALEMGVDMVEFDVRPCRNALVLIHDDTLSIMHHGTTFISQHTVEELHALTVDRIEPIATLSEAINLIGKRALMNIDLKGEGYEKQVIDLLERNKVLDSVIISSLEINSIREVRQLAPRVKTGISYPKRTRDSERRVLQLGSKVILKTMRALLPYYILRMIRRAQSDAVMLNHQLVSKSVVDKVHQDGKQLFVWTVNDSQKLKTLQEIGVDGITSDRPDLFSDIH